MQVTENITEKAKSMMGEEGKATESIEKVTSALPSTVWLAAAGISIMGSLTLKLFGRHATANFVGQWAPTFLILGLYNKIVKVAGSDRSERVLA